MSATPPAIDASSWSVLEPRYRELVERPLKCAGCLERLIADRSNLDAQVGEHEANLYIEMTCHTDDPQRQQAYLRFVEEIDPKLRAVGFELDRRIATSPLAAQLDPARYGVLLRNMRVEVELFRTENIPIQTELTRLDQAYSQIAGAQTVEFEGQERTLAQMSGFLEETDRARRESAWRAIFGRRFADRDAIDAIYDSMVVLRTSLAKNAGFPDFRDYQHRALKRFDYTPAECGSFHAGVEQVCVPLMREFDAERAETLGVGALRPWDLAVDVHGRSPLRPFSTADELVQRSSRMFHRMRPALGDMFDAMRGGGCLDLESRKGKAPGGYQYQRQWSRTPFIFMNAAGLQKDLVTMVHEAGHAFHSTYSREEPLLPYRNGPMEFNEVASMSMELLTFPYLDEFYDEEQAGRARRSLLEELTAKLAWIAQIDAFQHWVYTNPAHTRDERVQAWLELDERFGHAVDWAGFEPWRGRIWQRQLHLFGVPFYYIEYGIAQLGALQMWLAYREDPERALDSYARALTLGGSRALPELFAAAGLRFQFDAEIMKELMEAVRDELSVLPV